MAAIIVAVTILVVSARLPAAALRDDDGAKDRQEQREERLDERQERLEEEREESSGSGG